VAGGARQLRTGERIEARLRVSGIDDVLVSADADHSTIGLADPEGPATLETGSRVGPEALGRVRGLLSGY
jgi:hypothetical protein